MKFDELYIGQEYSKIYSVTEEKGRAFADVSQDYNLLHLDEEYAQNTMFKGRIAHGMLVASFISGVLGNEFPGTGTVYIRQELQFVRPVRYGDEISVIIKVIDMDRETKKVKLSTICRNQNGKNVIDGYAYVMKKDGDKIQKISFDDDNLPLSDSYTKVDYSWPAITGGGYKTAAFLTGKSDMFVFIVSNQYDLNTLTSDEVCQRRKFFFLLVAILNRHSGKFFRG